MNFLDVSVKERWAFVEWLNEKYPELTTLAGNIDQALIKGRRMTINSNHGISWAQRHTLLTALKEYYSVREQQLTSNY